MYRQMNIISKAYSVLVVRLQSADEQLYGVDDIHSVQMKFTVCR
jgi:hypothetical protein